MGAGSSIYCSPLAVQHVSLTIQAPNVIALMDCEDTVGKVHQTILTAWQIDGIFNVQYLQAFRLTEKPFAGTILGPNKAQVISTAQARQTFCRFFGQLDNSGIKVVNSIYTGKMFSRSTIILERGLVAGSELSSSFPVAERFICVAIRNRNVLQFPIVPGIANVKLDWLRSQFASQLSGDESIDEFIEFSFKGQIFGTNNRYEEQITTKRLFLQMVRQFATSGYQLSFGLSLRGGFRNETTFFKAFSSTPDTQPANYFLLCPEERNRLRLFECPMNAAKEIENSILSGQIREIKPSYMGCSEIVFTNTPFDTDSSQLADTQLMFLEIIGRLWSLGWKLKGAIQTSLGRYVKSTMLFETSTEEPRPIFGLAMVRSDTLKLFNAPTNVRTIVREIVLAVWSKGLQSESEINRGCCLKLKGRPFAMRDMSTDCSEGLHLLVCIIEKLKLCGWHLHCSLDVGARIVNEEDSHAYSADGSMVLFIRNDILISLNNDPTNEMSN
ncbi:hypothetical protein M3Y96_00753200 [Aphelenchoides besseyi]|nr:hypothetical protein M3Y96_00753200 [Aphelenchoides besseyi]